MRLTRTFIVEIEDDAPQELVDKANKDLDYSVANAEFVTKIWRDRIENALFPMEMGVKQLKRLTKSND